MVTEATVRVRRSEHARRAEHGQGLAALLAAGLVAGLAFATAWTGTADAAAPVPHGVPPSPVADAYWLVTPSGGSRPTGCRRSEHRPARSTGRW